MQHKLLCLAIKALFCPYYSDLKTCYTPACDLQLVALNHSEPPRAPVRCHFVFFKTKKNLLKTHVFHKAFGKTLIALALPYYN